MDDKIKLAKGIAKFAAGRSVIMVVTNAAKAHVPTKNKLEEIQLLIGAYVLAGMVSDHAITWADKRFDDAVSFVQSLKKSLKEQADA